jgi:hypothetical protein
MEKLCGPGTQLVDHGSASQRWTLDRGSAMASPELGLTAALGHSSSPTMAQRRERSTGSPSMASPGRGAMERREGEHGELRRRPVGHCPFIGGQRHRGFMADVNESTRRHRLPESRGGGGAIAVH